MSENLRQERNGRVFRLTLTRADKRNALTGAMCEELLDCFAEAGDDPSIGVILLSAEGKGFCAGMDLAETLQPAVAEITAVHERLFSVGARLTKQIVAAIQGDTFGGGVGLAANAHIAIASDQAQFGLTEIRLAMWPYTIYRSLVNAMGSRRTLELSLTGRRFSASEAREYGLVHQVVPAGELVDRAMEQAQALAQLSGDGLRRGMAFAHESASLSNAATGALALARRAEAFDSEDFREGVRAFQEKRAPRWPSNG